MDDADAYRRKHKEYAELRQLFYSMLQVRLLALTGLSVRATELLPSLIYETENWQNRRVEWDWSELRSEFGGYPARFELALCVGEVLCTLAVGRPSKGKRYMKLYYLEGNPDLEHPLKGSVLTSILEGFELYAAMLNCSVARLISPLDGVIPLYEAAGYSLAEGKHQQLYYEKPVKRS